ncbi:MAG TPA: HD domain-containing protein [Candidatus Paceibacterota bacterium]|nr:HD domain-containing protein [Candidatus Paceibacterota bacterium]
MKEKGATYTIPDEVSHVAETLEKQGFQAFLVGGCVRDLILGREPKDWDVTTDAIPEKITSAFSHTFYENDFGTVGVVNDETRDKRLEVVEVTPFRLEFGYSDKRRPDAVSFSDKLEDDLQRRDFTINALALKISKKGKGESFTGNITDLFDGQRDLKNRLIRTVGNPGERFREDALRIMRAVRIAAELDFEIEKETLEALKTHSNLLSHIAKERIRDEFVRIVMSNAPKKALELCKDLGILSFIAKEFEESFGIEQKGIHIYDVWNHLLYTIQHAADKKSSLEIRLAALFHDIGKPATRRFSHETNQYTFYGHEVVGARMTEKILRNLNFSKKMIDDVVKLVRWHMFFSDTEQISLSAVRRMIVNVGKDHIWDLMDVRTCDRIGSGRPKENPYRLRKYKAMIEEALRDPISVGMLKIDGKRLMEITGIEPGPKIGLILNALLEEVLDEAKLNTKEFLEKKAVELAKLPETELAKLAAIGKDKKARAEEEEIAKIRGKHGVK